MDFYRKKVEVALKIEGDKATGKACFTFQFATDKYLVGFDKFAIGYSGKDHHVKLMGLSITSKLEPDQKTLEVFVTANLLDSSRNHIGVGSVRLVVLAVPQSAKESGIALSALQEFSMEYQDNDHHISGYEIGQDIDDNGNGKAFMRDNSNHTSSGSCHVAGIIVPVEIEEKFREEGYDFIYSLSIWMEKGDHHLAHTGVEIDHGKVSYDLSDQHKNHAFPLKCKTGMASEIKDVAKIFQW